MVEENALSGVIYQIFEKEGENIKCKNGTGA